MAKKDERIDGVRYITIPVRDDIDDAGIEAMIRGLAPPVTNLAGNLADLQRGGAAVAAGGSLSDGVELPAGVSDQDLAVSKAVDDAVASAVAQSTGLANSAGHPNTGDTGGTTASRKMPVA